MTIREAIPSGAEFTYDSGIQRLEQQSHQVEAFDNKAAVIIAINGVVGGLLVNAMPVGFAAAPLVGLVTLGALLLSLMTAILAFWTRPYDTAPSVESLGTKMGSSPGRLKFLYLSNVVQAIENNREKLDQKGWLLGISIAALFVEVGVVGAYLIWFLGAKLAKG